MKKNDLLTITTVALGTATLTVAAFWAGPIEAGAEADAPTGKINRAALVSHGVQMSLTAATGHVFKAGDQPEFELTALNTTQQPASASVCVTMTSTSPAEAFARVISIPTVMWQQDQVVTLKPNEKRTFTLCAATNLPPNKLMTVTLREPDQKSVFAAPGVMSLTFSTVIPKSAPPVVAAR